MNVLTGYGYYLKDGLKLSKYELPIGYHNDPSDGSVMVEVPDKDTLDSISLDKTPEEIKAKNLFDIELQLENNRKAFIDAMIAGDNATQQSIKASQSDLLLQKNNFLKN